APLIVFPNEYACHYGSVECWGGWDPYQGPVTANNTTAPVALNCSGAEYSEIENCSGNRPLDMPRLSVYVEYMPAHTVSLLRIPAGGKTGSASDSAIQPALQVGRIAGSVLLQLSGEFDNCDLSLYDIMGRKVEEIEIHEAEGHEILLNADSYSAGMYFVVLREEADIVQMEKISIF
ncbi:MAG: T9SS type A sorting domain-containing protein, partial [Candidatus Sabulitectum sp.]|nr:T9SS type A sorting domain-containing protein [Candidatus Sabulitectum sp.]